MEFTPQELGLIYAAIGAYKAEIHSQIKWLRSTDSNIFEDIIQGHSERLDSINALSQKIVGHYNTK